jgi:hypothetical protein
VRAILQAVSDAHFSTLISRHLGPTVDMVSANCATGGAHSWRVTMDGTPAKEGATSELDQWQQLFHEVGAVFIGADGKDEEEAQALRMSHQVAALPGAQDLLGARQRLRTTVAVAAATAPGGGPGSPVAPGDLSAIAESPQ